MDTLVFGTCLRSPKACVLIVLTRFPMYLRLPTTTEPIAPPFLHWRLTCAGEKSFRLLTAARIASCILDCTLISRLFSWPARRWRPAVSFMQHRFMHGNGGAAPRRLPDRHQAEGSRLFGFQ